MKLYITYDFTKTFKAILNEKLQALNLNYTLVGTNEIEFNTPLSETEKTQLSTTLQPYGITIETDQNHVMVDKIKLAINEMLNSDAVRLYNTSDYLSEKLNYSYTYLSSIFSETTYTSIENYIILTKVDKAKEMLLHTDATLTQIAFELNYSSVAHLSRQFKKTTGLTPSVFQRIIKKRKQLS